MLRWMQTQHCTSMFSTTAEQNNHCNKPSRVISAMCVSMNIQICLRTERMKFLPDSHKKNAMPQQVQTNNMKQGSKFTCCNECFVQ